MRKNSNESNNLLKTIALIIIIAITCLIFFGLNENSKTDVEIISFVFIIFTEVIVYFSFMLPNILNTKKLNNYDIISAGLLYALISLTINFAAKITEIRPLIVYNIIALLIYFLIFIIAILIKKK